ncbi:ArgE/DapE family deacylase [Mesorhizobium sp.]|uniref:M20 family metallopeptidase n=1 Tax=Mesorhizobium sp. TaxID=1871066 RepID=UPI000FE2ECC8|nr:ArgE/DapE family deacylase [Mesorhizobium sp.]RWQ13506.1 MAG: M20 family peptidase [Mesorhizobium sp.]
MSNVSAQTVALLQELVKIESVNPSLSPKGSGEKKVAEFLERFCRERNLPYEIQEVTDGRSNFLTWVPGHDPDKRVLFIAHMDTVPVDKWESDPFSGEQREGRIYGRGSCDTKASLAAMLMALSTLGERQPKTTVVVAASIDEEYRKIGARAIAQSGVSYDAAVVGECTNLELVVAHMGSLRWQIEVEGVPAHTSRPHLGVNAITGMAKIILALDEYHRTLVTRAHPLVGSPLLTVSLIEGGLELTTVPPACRIWIDRRLIPGEQPQDALQEVENILEAFRQGEHKIKVRSLLPALEDPAPNSAEASRIAAVAAAVCADVAGTGKYIGGTGGSDANQLSLAGIPCIVLGPGSTDQAHTNNEFVEVDQVAKAVEIYQKIMLSY